MKIVILAKKFSRIEVWSVEMLILAKTFCQNQRSDDENIDFSKDIISQSLFRI